MRSSADVFSHIEAHKGHYLEELVDLLRFPSISTDPAHKDDMEACALHLSEQLERIGLTAERFVAGGHPLVYGERLGAPGRPTVLVYGHYDVQPADPLEEWRHPPFEPAIEDGNLIGRGTTDDKGQLFCHLKAAEAILAVRGELGVNLKILLEGEEESGGESVLRFVKDDAGRRLAADVVLISDSPMLAPGQPTLFYGVRGISYMELRVDGPNRDLHSGESGGAVANPANALGKIVGLLTDAAGRILIPGFYDDVRPAAGWEREEIARLEFDEAAYCADLGIDTVFGEVGYTTWERICLRPTCDVHGLWGGYAGSGEKTVLPSFAGAKVSMRLVPDQDPRRIAELFTTYVETVAPPGVRVDVRYLSGTPPVLVDTEGPLAEATMAAMCDVWGVAPHRLRGGGSLPVTGVFAETLGVPVLLVGFGLLDDGPHGPNEKLSLDQFYGGIRSVVRILDRIGEAPTMD